MKKIIVIVALVFLGITSSFSQVYADGVDLNTLNLKYIKLTGVNTSVFGVKYKIYIDYGQKVKTFKASKIKDAKGKTMKFNTMIDALNFMDSNGWNFLTHSETLVNGKIVTAYLLVKE